MRALLPILALLMSPAAHARRAKKAEPSAHNEEGKGLFKRRQGSLWDFIEPADDQADTATEKDTGLSEMDREHALEQEVVSDDPIDALDALKFAEQYDDDDPLHRDRIDPDEFDIPVVFNDDVAKWMEYFLGRGRPYFEKWMARRGTYQPMIHDKLEEADLPLDTIYLSMIESGFNAHAYSRAAAVGLWQFMSPTARDYDMRVDSWIDERRDPVRSTEGAIDLLSDLHDRYGDWYLAWAAYNAGPGRINKAIKYTGSRDFWVIADSGHVRAETANYVPKLLAAAIIAKHPERYGFDGIEPNDPLDVEPVEIEGPFALDVLAKCAAIDAKQMGTLNPHIRQGALPAATVRINVPTDRRERFETAAAAVPADERITVQQHRVVRGETLGTIAKHYGTSAGAIQTMNGIADPNRISVGATLTIPTNGSSPQAASAPPARPTRHTVARGETLSGIASRYGVSARQIQQWNRISNANHLRVGQTLTLKAASPVWESVAVRSGDTLTGIARRQGCTVEQLRQWNGIAGTTIYVGQTLKIRRS